MVRVEKKLGCMIWGRLSAKILSVMVWAMKKRAKAKVPMKKPKAILRLLASLLLL